MPFLTRAGAEVMRGESPARIMLPARTAPPEKRRARSGDSAPTRKRDAPVELTDADRPLFERLRVHRAEIARERKLPAYVIALDRTLVELARRRPTTLTDLASVYGFGPSRIEQYGQGFLDALATT